MTVPLEENRAKKSLWFYAAFGGVLFVIAVAIAWNFYAIRSAARWLAWSQRYKAEVLAEPSVSEELKHIQWDGWGWAGQDTTVYLVFDPTDSLLAAARQHPWAGLPLINRLVTSSPMSGDHACQQQSGRVVRQRRSL